MAQFTDSKNETWTLSPDVPMLREIRDTHNINLTTIDGSGWEELGNDVLAMYDILWMLCKDEATARGINERDFCLRLTEQDGKGMDSASAALLESISGFFRQSRRKLLSAIAAKNEAQIEAMIANLDDPEVTAAMNQRQKSELLKSLSTPSTGATSLPDTLDAIQPDEPGQT